MDRCTRPNARATLTLRLERHQDIQSKEAVLGDGQTGSLAEFF
jgi:hypothetical protein